jgi:hypothetical protein
MMRRRRAVAILVAYIVTSMAACAPLTLEYIYNESPANSDPNKLVVAHCPAGKKVTGGGAHVGPQIAPLALIRSQPTNGAQGWIAHALEVSPYPDTWVVGATAICVKANP